MDAGNAFPELNVHTILSPLRRCNTRHVFRWRRFNGTERGAARSREPILSSIGGPIYQFPICSLIDRVSLVELKRRCCLLTTWWRFIIRISSSGDGDDPVA